MNPSFASIQEALDDIRQGKMIILVDDEDRENEGDLIVAAEMITPEIINFMSKFGRGLICLTMQQSDLDRLRVPLMVENNLAYLKTAFTISIDAAKGITTGVSAADRAKTILAAIHPQSSPKDIVMPGHIFPLRAKAGGVLVRGGHTEGSTDLAQLAGLIPSAVICEIMNDDGSMARLPDLIQFAKIHQLKIVSINDIIAHRMRNECLVSEISSARLPLEPHGEFTIKVFENVIDQEQHVALIRGDIDPEKEILVRVHSECLTGDVFGSSRCDCGWQLQSALQTISQEGGVLLYMRQEGRGIGLASKIKAYALQEQGHDTVEANHLLGYAADHRDYGIGSQILRYLNVRKMRLLTNNPRKIHGISGYGLEITSVCPIEMPATKESLGYLQTKRDKLGHLLKCV